MHIITDYNNCPTDAQNSVIALGNFDGVHKGHQEIIKQVVKLAKDNARPAAVMTFEPHPISLFKPDVENYRLTDLDKKAYLLEQLGIDYIFAMQFDADFAQITAQDFISDILAKNLMVSHVVIGYDFIFGRKKAGDGQLLQDYASKYDYGFSQIQAIGDDEIYSSTQVRKSLQKGDLGLVRQILGRNHQVSGQVVHGDNRGKDIGFPTINVDINELLMPANGVYAVRVALDDDIYDGVANIGTRPTFDGVGQQLEVHIFDFDQDIYGANVQVELVAYIRQEQKFENADALVAQIKEDCSQAVQTLTA